MQLRRPLALMTGALVLSLGGLTSCGFDLATDRPYTARRGDQRPDGEVDVLTAVVVAAQPNEGTFVLTLVNNSKDDISLDGVAGQDLEVGRVLAHRARPAGDGQPRRRGRDPGQR